MVTGIGLVNRVHRGGEAGDFLPLDYRVYAPDHYGQTKNDHFLALFDHVVTESKLLFRTILFDSGYAGSTNLKRIHRAGWTFFTTLQRNRLVRLTKENGYPGPRHARTAAPRRGSVPERSALWGKTIQAGGHKRQY